MKKVTIGLFAIGLLTGVSSGVSAQQTIKKEVRVEVLRGGMPSDKLTQTFEFVSDGAGFADSKTVKNAPYAGEFTSESIQTFADGNRIVRRSSSKVFRDNEGRLRREQTLNHIGSLTTGGEPQTFISILDPVAGTNYFLNSNDKTARKSRAVTFGGGKMLNGKVFDFKGVPPMPPPRLDGSMRVYKKPFGEPKVESLGTQNIAGVDAEGTRTTVTIPAEAIGNERAFDIVHEVWKSKDLGIIVLSKHSDPMTGEQTYQATKIIKGEQAKSLFEVPADYKVNETPGNYMRRPFNAPPPPSGQVETQVFEFKKKQQ
ncbi:MAG: hypothetical protein H7Z37_18730 [Pyrinomonadaceae bacterium]|nr:hypothetical protein [Pyrinomonadaceae bacterium]